MVGWSWAAPCGAAVPYVTRLIGITVFYHRGSSHRAFKKARPFQLAEAILGASAAQRGPLGGRAPTACSTASRTGPEILIRRVVDGFLQSHAGWLFRPPIAPPRKVEDLARVPELRFVDHDHHVAPILTAFGRQRRSEGCTRDCTPRDRRCWSGASFYRPRFSTTPPSR